MCTSSGGNSNKNMGLFLFDFYRVICAKIYVFLDGVKFLGNETLGSNVEFLSKVNLDYLVLW